MNTVLARMLPSTLQQTHTHTHSTILLKDKSSLKTQLDWGAKPTKTYHSHTDIHGSPLSLRNTHTHTHIYTSQCFSVLTCSYFQR